MPSLTVTLWQSGLEVLSWSACAVCEVSIPSLNHKKIFFQIVFTFCGLLQLIVVSLWYKAFVSAAWMCCDTFVNLSVMWLVWALHENTGDEMHSRQRGALKEQSNSLENGFSLWYWEVFMFRGLCAEYGAGVRTRYAWLAHLKERKRRLAWVPGTMSWWGASGGLCPCCWDLW